MNRRRFAILLLFLAGAILGYVLHPLLANFAEPDPSRVETYAVVKSPDNVYACVITRQRFGAVMPLDFYTFTVWWLDPHGGGLLFPIDGPSEVVRPSMEEGPPLTPVIRVHWRGKAAIASWYYEDGTFYADLMWDGPGDRWHWGDEKQAGTTQPTSSPSTMPAE